MNITTVQVVKGRAAKVAEPRSSEEFDVAEVIADETCESETPELSIEQLEEIFRELN